MMPLQIGDKVMVGRRIGAFRCHDVVPGTSDVRLSIRFDGDAYNQLCRRESVLFVSREGGHWPGDLPTVMS